jgi:TonB family protein
MSNIKPYTNIQLMHYLQCRQFIGLTIFLVTAASAQSGEFPPNPPTPDAAASTSARTATAEDGRVIASSALGACFRRPPQYPAAALREEQEGRTVVSFEVSATGVAERPVVLRSSQFALLDEAALSHMKKCLKATAIETAGMLPPGRYALPLVWRLE